ncbi:uncharacterized protein LOC114516708 [Dendronephthya gigantea]|uniref:uncharacterized protein LOC114516708 n=1 Tax=Dendronephthya gigantea TaxID=151771 RepID=UPI00106CE774|nr:uncharacterized protein LOC114516708 [Dendronephthya gigantea]
MTEANCSSPSPSTSENLQEKCQNETILKDSNKKICKKKTKKMPAKIEDTRYCGPPFSKEVYNLFVSSIKYGEPAYPTTKELRKLDFFTTKGTRHRKRFKELLKRFELHIVQGSLVLSSNLEEDVLVVKRSGKIIIPKEDLEKIIRRAHLWGNNGANGENVDERKCKHYNVGRTITVLGKDFTIKRREFGVTREVVQKVIAQCMTCNKGRLLANNEIRLKQLNNVDENMVRMGYSSAEIGSSQVSSQRNNEKSELEKARFPSMVAHVPDKTCIWYDRKSIAETSNSFQKLKMVVGEMQGEISLVVKGDAEAKQRLEAKLYCAQLLIKDHCKSIQKLLVLENSPKVFRTELGVLEMEYKEAGQSSNFSSDIENVLEHVKAKKLIVSPVITRELEDIVTLQNGRKKTKEAACGNRYESLQGLTKESSTVNESHNF